MKLIPLTQGKFAKVDDADFEALNKHKWLAVLANKNTGLYYAARNVGGHKKQKITFMHRVLLGLTDPKIFGDHRNGDGLDNQRKNIRPSTNSQNTMNRGGSPGCQYKGVNVNKRNGKIYYRAKCQKNGISHYRKAASLEDAARKYNELAVELHGEFAFLNVFD